jgi:hypothetical protein
METGCRCRLVGSAVSHQRVIICQAASDGRWFSVVKGSMCRCPSPDRCRETTVEKPLFEKPSAAKWPARESDAHVAGQTVRKRLEGGQNVRMISDKKRWRAT